MLEWSIITALIFTLCWQQVSLAALRFTLKEQRRRMSAIEERLSIVSSRTFDQSGDINNTIACLVTLNSLYEQLHSMLTKTANAKEEVDL